MHLFLTGERQIGKSTAITRALTGLPLQTGGFRTLFFEQDGERVLALRPYGAAGAPDAGSIVARHIEGHMVADPARFNVLGTAALAAASGVRLMLMDECGFLERDAEPFQRAVLTALAGHVPVLGVVRQGTGDWLERIRRHPNVTLLQLTMENREAIPQRIRAWIQEAVR